MNGDSEFFRAKLTALTAGYAARLSDRLAEVAAAAAAIGDSGTSPAAVKAVRDLAHKLVGSAPTFGFAAVGAAAAEVERACDAWLADPAARAGQTARILTAVAALGVASRDGA